MFSSGGAAFVAQGLLRLNASKDEPVVTDLHARVSQSWLVPHRDPPILLVTHVQTVELGACPRSFYGRSPIQAPIDEAEAPLPLLTQGAMSWRRRPPRQRRRRPARAVALD